MKKFKKRDLMGNYPAKAEFISQLLVMEIEFKFS